MAQTKHVLLVHGWSSQAKKQRALADFLKTNGYQVTDIFLGDYPSTDDDVKIEDAAARMGDEVQSRLSQGTLGPRFHMIVHSTGALVARLWMAQRFADGKNCPVVNFLMLAPANFGSPLANLGRSVLGRATVGLGNWFQTGTEMLHGLELGAQLQQDIAMMDRLARPGESPDTPFSVGRTRPYVIVGALLVPGTQFLPQTGWDGTVRIASANFNPQGLTVDFSGKVDNPNAQAVITPWVRKGPEAPFAVMPDRNHLNITNPADSEAKDPDQRVRLGKMILAALEIETAQDYARLRSEWEAITHTTRTLATDAQARRAMFGRKPIPAQRFHQHYQVVVDVHDSAGHTVDEYGIWLSSPKSRNSTRVGGRLGPDEEAAYGSVLQDTHTNRRDRHRQVLHLDRMALFGDDGFFDRFQNALLASISAPPLGRNIDFGLKQDQAYGYLPLRSHKPSNQMTDTDDRFLRRYATHFVEVILPRKVGPKAFQVKDYRTVWPRD